MRAESILQHDESPGNSDEPQCEAQSTADPGQPLDTVGLVRAGNAIHGEPPDKAAQELPSSADTPTKPPGPAAPGLGAAAPDPFDPASLRLSLDVAAGLGVKKALLSIPVRKPDKSWFVRVHPAADYRLQTAVIELKEDRETYLVAPALWPELASEATFSPRALFLAMNRQGVVFVWPVRLPGPDGKVDEWSRTALEGTDRATKGWIRITANMALGAYDLWEATHPLSEPEWPSMSYADILRIAFKGRYIDTWDHPVLRRLRGEV